MAIDTPARHIYTGNGNQRVFPIPTKIIGDDYIRIEIDSVYQSDRTKWDIVNNSVIFITAPLNGVTIDIQVATSEEALSVLGSSTAMDIVAESITNVNITATNIVDINTVSHNITEVDTVANNISSVVITANDSDEINILASIHTQLESLYADMAKITSLYNDKITLDSLYSDKTKLDAIFSDLNAIEGLFSIKAKLESIYADKSKLDSIFADKSKLDSIYADKTQLDTIFTNISNILTVYTNISSVITVSNNIASVNTTASNIVDVNTFSNRYKIGSAQPSSPTAGDLWYDTVATVLKYYNGSSYVTVSPDVTFLLTNTKFINSISIGNTTLSGWTNSFSVVEAPGGTFFASDGIAALTGSNCYYDGVNWKYKADGTAGLQVVNQGTHTFRTAVSGLAGATITWVTVASIDSTGLIVPTPTSGNEAVNKSYVDNLSTKVGTIIAFPANIAPTGFLECNGALISRTSYANLFAVIGTTYGAGNGSTTFALPDLRGEFIRGLDNGRGVDINRTIGSYQNDAFKSHTHNTATGSGHTTGSGSHHTMLGLSTSYGKTSSATGDNETRPRNIAMMYCIKY